MELKTLHKWNLSHAIGMLMASLVVLFTHNLASYGMLAIISFSFIVYTYLGARKSVEIGKANSITLIRLLMLISSCFFFEYFSTIQLFSIFLTNTLLDVLDGYLARKYNESSTFGMYLDMEVDAFFVMLMCAYYYLFRDIDFWILIPGLLRYIYVVIVALLPKREMEEKGSKYATYIAGIFFIILLLGGLMDGLYLEVFLGVGSTLIVLSFAKSFIDNFSWGKK